MCQKYKKKLKLVITDWNVFTTLLVLSILINVLGFLNPLLRNDDPALYANIAKHIVQYNDWVNLSFNNAVWLDKPHFPFWMVALSFKIFGINSFAYILPGFIFYLLGGYYTYRLASFIYDKPIGYLATLIYFSSLHLMLSSIDLRAEAYLLGTIVPAIYYWCKYENITYSKERIFCYELLWGAIFTALAVMTKGIFVLITIASGFICKWLVAKKITQLFSVRCLVALILVFIFILPELICLYWQFDMHPLQVIFGKTHVSGIKWFFWDSQFGRFFNTGRIKVNHINHWHYLFFVHVLLWSMLPWSIMMILALYNLFPYKKRSIQKISNKESNIYQCDISQWNISQWGIMQGGMHRWDLKLVFLWGIILPTFILFSVTKFQLDYYTNILIPFFAIIIAKYLYEIKTSINTINKGAKYSQVKILYYLQLTILAILFLGTMIVSLVIFSGYWLIVLILIIAINLLIVKITAKIARFYKIIIYSVLVINSIFILLMMINGIIYKKYDVGYQVAQVLGSHPKYKVVDWQLNSLTLQFYIQTCAYYAQAETITSLEIQQKPFFLVMPYNNLAIIKKSYPNWHIDLVTVVRGNTIDVILAHLLNPTQLNKSLQNYAVLLVTN